MKKIFLILSIIIISSIYFYKIDNFENINYANSLDVKDIFNHSLVIHLVNHEESKKRLKKIKKIYNYYGIPYNLYPALHWKTNEKELYKLPITRSKPKMWGGTWGLSGSFYKCLKFAYESNYPFLLFLEDDAFPSMKKKYFYFSFKKITEVFRKNIDTNNVYFLSFTRYCSQHCGETNKFINPLPDKKINGAHSILFTRKSIKNILDYIHKYTIDEPIDNYLNKLHRNKIINIKIWDGKISKSGMFCGMYDQLDTYCHSRKSVIGNHYHY